MGPSESLGKLSLGECVNGELYMHPLDRSARAFSLDNRLDSNEAAPPPSQR